MSLSRARAQITAALARPYPPQFSGFLPAPELLEWAQGSFIAEGATLHNPDHEHLAEARIGALWTTVENVTKQRRIAGTAELPTPPPTGGKWSRARHAWQLSQWFGEEPLDFLLTFDASLALEADDATICALVEHELYHCGQALDEWGQPKFHRNGSPVYAILGHDAEEFVGVVRRYGVGAAAGGVAELVAAAKRKPEVGLAEIGLACGTCLARAA